MLAPIQHRQRALWSDALVRRTALYTSVLPLSVAAVPPGWEQKVDPSSGKPYYVDHNTATTHWEPPAPPPAYDAPPAYSPPGTAPAAAPAAVEGVPGQGVVYAAEVASPAPAGYGQPIGGGVPAAPRVLNLEMRSFREAID